LAATRRKWPVSRQTNRDFAIAFREFLAIRIVTRNGNAGAATKRISQYQKHNILDCVRTLFNWAKRVQINKLPASFINPFDAEIVGQRPKKGSLRAPLLPVERRIELILVMDELHLSHLMLSLLLPLRPEDCAGLLIRDIDFQRGVLRFGNRFDGRDFKKGKVTFEIPFPAEVAPLLSFCRVDREDGPLLRSRRIFERKRQPNLVEFQTADVETCIEDAFRRASPTSAYQLCRIKSSWSAGRSDRWAEYPRMNWRGNSRRSCAGPN
jgi:integrase